MKFLKIGYYLKSARILFQNLRSFDFTNKVLEFKNGLKFKTTSILDLLVIKETIFDDSYQLNSLKDPKLIIDVGGGLGDFCIFAAKRFPNCRIIVFEPDPVFWEMLDYNIKINNIGNITSYPHAVGQDETIEFFPSVNHVQSGRFSDLGTKILVKSVSLSGHTKSRVDLLKIDCEGGEKEIISNLDSKNIRKIALEYHKKYDQNIDNLIFKKLTKEGYECSIVQDAFDSSLGYIFAKQRK